MPALMPIKTRAYGNQRNVETYAYLSRLNKLTLQSIGDLSPDGLFVRVAPRQWLG